MDPFAYGLREHIVFNEPFEIPTSDLSLEWPTPAAFSSQIPGPTIDVVPLVRQIHRDWQDGWCTYTDGFTNNPDLELICGGVNEKTATAAAIWRQGNLLHFGFQQSPAEMNEVGQMLLLNVIEYISRFTEDRPIAVTPSVFGGPVGYPRSYLDRRIESGALDSSRFFISQALYDRLVQMSEVERRSWYKRNRGFLSPNHEMKLDVDENAVDFGVFFDNPEFFVRAIELIETAKDTERAWKLIDRYGPVGAFPGRSLLRLKSWFDSNQSYLFFSDQGDYRWYVDPLAKKRGVPSKSLRGQARASH